MSAVTNDKEKIKFILVTWDSAPIQIWNYPPTVIAVIVATTYMTELIEAGGGYENMEATNVWIL